MTKSRPPFLYALTKGVKRGIRTDKGEVNRQIAADNKLLKEIKARVTRLYNWTKAEAEKPEGKQSTLADLWEIQQQQKQPATRTGRIRVLQENAALFSFLQSNGIQSMQQLHEKISDMNSCYRATNNKTQGYEQKEKTEGRRGEETPFLPPQMGQMSLLRKFGELGKDFPHALPKLFLPLGYILQISVINAPGFMHLTGQLV